MKNNNNEKIRAFCAAMREDFCPFLQKAYTIVDNSQALIFNWHLELIADVLQRCATGKSKRVIINLPPRNLKSQTVSVAYSAWLLGIDPSARILNICYSSDLAAKLSRDAKRLILSDFYKQIFPNTVLRPDKQTETLFETTANGFRYATSIGGTLTGIGGNYIIIDDPIKAADASSATIRESINEWYNNTLVSRLDNKKEGVIILVMQRLHLDDLTGHLLKQAGWEVISLPAIATKDEQFILSDGRCVGRKAGEALNPQLEPIEELNKLKATMSNYNFSAQYQQAPLPEKGNIIDYDKFKHYDNLPIDGEIIQSWDIAFKTGVHNDYTVCITALFHENKFYITDIYRDKIDVSNLPIEIAIQRQKYQCKNVIIEATTSTELLIKEIEKFRINPIRYQPKVSKIERATNISFSLARGEILLPQKASWLDDFRAEIVTFPSGLHDDQVDALTQLILATNQINDGSNIIKTYELLNEYNQSEDHKMLHYKRFVALGLNRIV